MIILKEMIILSFIGNMASNPCDATWRYFSVAGYCYQLSSDEVTWDSAREYCATIESHLVSVTSPMENAFLKEYLTNLSVPEAWIGLYKHGLTNNSHYQSLQTRKERWRWVDGEAYDFVNWSENEPTAYQPENVTRIRRDGTWGDTAYWKKMKFLCKKPVTQVSITLELLGGADNKHHKPVEVTPSRRCDDDWTLNPNSGFCYRLSRELLDWDAANDTCRSMNSYLASVISSSENKFVVYILKTRQVNETWIGLYKLGLTRNYYQKKLRDRRAGWLWEDRSRYDYSNWRGKNPLEPSGYESERSARMHIDGFWGDQDYTLPLHFLCKKASYVVNVIPSTAQGNHTNGSEVSPVESSEDSSFATYFGVSVPIVILIIVIIVVAVLFILKARRREPKQIFCSPYPPSTLRRRYGPPLSKADISGPSNFVRDVPDDIDLYDPDTLKCHENEYMKNEFISSDTSIYSGTYSSHGQISYDVTYAQAQTPHMALKDADYSEEEAIIGLCDNIVHVDT